MRIKGFKILNSQIKKIVWQQFGAAIDMLENANTAYSVFCTVSTKTDGAGRTAYIIFTSVNC